MSCIHGKDTKPEEIVRKYLFSKGFRYRKNDKKLPGSPDVVLPKYRTVIFVNGCFWHGHDGCRYFIWPKNNAKFWHHKIETNIERDARKKKQLEDAGWNVIVVWECQLRPENVIKHWKNWKVYSKQDWKCITEKTADKEDSYYAKTQRKQE